MIPSLQNSRVGKVNMATEIRSGFASDGQGK